MTEFRSQLNTVDSELGELSYLSEDILDEVNEYQLTYELKELIDKMQGLITDIQESEKWI